MSTTRLSGSALASARSASPARHHQSQGSIGGSPRRAAGAATASRQASRIAVAQRSTAPASSPSARSLAAIGEWPSAQRALDSRISARYGEGRAVAPVDRPPQRRQREEQAPPGVGIRVRRQPGEDLRPTQALAVHLEGVRVEAVAALEPLPEPGPAALDRGVPGGVVVARRRLDRRRHGELRVGAERGLDPGADRGDGPRVLVVEGPPGSRDRSSPRRRRPRPGRRARSRRACLGRAGLGLERRCVRGLAACPRDVEPVARVARGEIGGLERGEAIVGGHGRIVPRASPGGWRCVTIDGMELTFLGGARTVTGSRHLVDTGRAKVLIDCGMFQGGPDETMRNRVPLGVDPATLDAVILTHAHLDHCGLLPLLVHEGFRGAIVCTAATAELARLVLLDSAKLQEEFAKRATRRAKRDPDRAAHDAARSAEDYDEVLTSRPSAPRARAARTPRSCCGRPVRRSCSTWATRCTRRTTST